MIIKISDKEFHLNYIEQAKSQIALLFIHGNSCSKEIWSKQLNSELAEKYTLITFDLLGHGETMPSSNPELDYTIFGYITQIKQIIKGLRLEKYILVGFSLGGHASIESLLEIEGCIGAFCTGIIPTNFPPEANKMFLPDATIELIYKEDWTVKEEDEFVNSMFMPGSELDKTVVLNSVRKADPKVRSVLAQSLAEGKMKNELDLLKTIDVPLALIHGKEDQYINSAYLEELSIDKWEDKVHYINNAGHFCFYENPSEFNSLLSSFAEYCIQRKI